jgi:hypothetical protein
VSLIYSLGHSPQEGLPSSRSGHPKEGGGWLHSHKGWEEFPSFMMGPQKWCHQKLLHSHHPRPHVGKCGALQLITFEASDLILKLVLPVSCALHSLHMSVLCGFWTCILDLWGTSRQPLGRETDCAPVGRIDVRIGGGVF